MKKTIKIFTVMFMVLVLLPLQTIAAADGSVSIAGPAQLEPGESGNYTISFYADDTAYFEYSISGVNISVSGSGIAGDGEGNSASVVVTATAGGAGYSTIYVDVIIATTGSSVSVFNRSASKPVLIEAFTTPETPAETPGGNNNPGNGNSTNTPPPVQTPEEEAAAKEAEEAAAKELAQKTPLIKSIDVISMSPKKNNQSVTLITPTEDTWAYEYSLPKRIDKFSLLINGVDNDVVITFDKEHEFKEGEATSKEILVRAVKDDIVQEYTLKITKDNSVPAVVELDGKKITVFEDDELDDYMKSTGFERKTYLGSNKAEISYFSIGKVNLQLVINDAKEARWHLLSEDLKLTEPVSLQLDSDKKPFFIMDAPVEIGDQTLNGKKYEKTAGKVDDILLNLDSSIKWVNDYKAWNLEDGELVYGMSEDGVRDTFKRNTEAKSTLAIVSFDAPGSKAMTILAMASTTGFIILAGYILTTTILNVRKRKQNGFSDKNLDDSNSSNNDKEDASDVDHDSQEHEDLDASE